MFSLEISALKWVPLSNSRTTIHDMKEHKNLNFNQHQSEMTTRACWWRRAAWEGWWLKRNRLKTHCEIIIFRMNLVWFCFGSVRLGRSVGSFHWKSCVLVCVGVCLWEYFLLFAGESARLPTSAPQRFLLCHPSFDCSQMNFIWALLNGDRDGRVQQPSQPSAHQSRWDIRLIKWILCVWITFW